MTQHAGQVVNEYLVHEVLAFHQYLLLLMQPATAQHRAKLLPIAQSHSDPGVLLQPCNNSSK
jgi:hypothetical protein